MDSIISFIGFCIINLTVVLLISPLFIGIIKKVKALAQFRKGQSLFQPYLNLMKLLKKETIYSSNASWIMRVTPYVNLIAVLAASLFIPLAVIPQFDGSGDIGDINGNNSINFTFGNIIVFLYLLALARFFMSLAGLDAGSTFGGMGSSREMSISSIIEPVTIIVFAAIAMIFHTVDIYSVFNQTANAGSGVLLNPSIILIGISLFLILIVETARLPVDNPETHLELTMIHEAMILEQSGKNLAMMEISAAIKQTLFIAVLVNLLLPYGITSEMHLYEIGIAICLFIIKGSILAIVIGIFESSLAKMRLLKIHNFFMIAAFLSILTIFMEIFNG